MKIIVWYLSNMSNGRQTRCSKVLDIINWYLLDKIISESIKSDISLYIIYSLMIILLLYFL